MKYEKVARQIAKECPGGFRVSRVRLDFGDADNRTKERACRRFRQEATKYLSRQIDVIPDETVTEWHFEIIHRCGNQPLYDEEAQKWYCPVCTERSFFDH